MELHSRHSGFRRSPEGGRPIEGRSFDEFEPWIPAFAGMTGSQKVQLGNSYLIQTMGAAETLQSSCCGVQGLCKVARVDLFAYPEPVEG